jgi:opacity protein-like surface antigen
MASRIAPLFVLPLLAATAAPASAADLAPEPPPIVESFAPWTYVSIEGGPVWTDNGLNQPEFDKFGDIEDGTGFYAAATLRRMFNPSWDWQLTGTGTWLPDINASNEDGDTAHSDLDFQTVDFDFGYHFNGNPLTRLHFGARFLHASDSLDYFSEGYDEYFSYEAKGWAIGPRVGLQSETMLGKSRFGFVAEASGSVLFGSFDVDRHYSSGGTSTSSNESRTVYNLEGLAGLSWHASDRMTFTVGYRAQQWWDLRKGAGIDADGYLLQADEDVLVHGPFLRAAVTF